MECRRVGWTAAPTDGVSSSAARSCWVSAGLVERAGSLPQLKKVPLPSGCSHCSPACRAERTDSEPAPNTDFYSYLFADFWIFLPRTVQDRRGISRLAFWGQCFCCSTQVHPSSLLRLLDVPTRGDPGNAFSCRVRSWRRCRVQRVLPIIILTPHCCFLFFLLVLLISSHIVGRFPAVEVPSFWCVCFFIC